MAKGVYNYNQIHAGECPYITRVKVAAGEYKRGDLLECVVTTGTPASTYKKPTAAATMANLYVICSEDVKATANQEVVVFPEGYFNENKINVAGALATNKEILKTKNIYLVPAQNGTVE